ncbi:fibrinogen C domain-containing protein 1 [Aplysia californica]|uniref:Fibrinogen C domain-containing protein 1 n=1 Tax=Aplysia californica TaxID=6500 RepID=A0ABM0JZV0_APLCA|nr:fibrinogen C domain-containing protein 1 [Aplysia californica]
MGLNMTSGYLLLATAVLLSSNALLLNVTTDEVEIGKTKNVSLECIDDHIQPHISEVLMIRILKKDLVGWSSFAELRDRDTEVTPKRKDVLATANKSSIAKSFLRLTWPVATDDAIGQYRCDVISLTSRGNVNWQKTLPTFISQKSDVTLKILNKIVEENKKDCLQRLQSQRETILDNVTTTAEENKRQCMLQKDDILRNVTATVESLGVSFEDQLQVLSQTVDQNKRECPHQMLSQKRQILENVEAIMEQSKREFIQREERILGNVTAIVEALEAGFERKLSAMKSQLQTYSCADVTGLGDRPVVRLFSGMEVVCDTITDNGGWIVIQRRASADVDFFRSWADYKNGFGDRSGNFWFGLEKIHQLTNQRKYELRIDMKYKGKDYHATYNNFLLHGESENYKLQISGFSGNVQDNMKYNNGEGFSTKDRGTTRCAKQDHGAWWYDNCTWVNLNGAWGNTESEKGLIWESVTGHSDSVTFCEMKIRPFDK